MHSHCSFLLLTSFFFFFFIYLFFVVYFSSSISAYPTLSCLSIFPPPLHVFFVIPHFFLSFLDYLVGCLGLLRQRGWCSMSWTCSGYPSSKHGDSMKGYYITFYYSYIHFIHSSLLSIASPTLFVYCYQILLTSLLPPSLISLPISVFFFLNFFLCCFLSFFPPHLSSHSNMITRKPYDPSILPVECTVH